MRNADLAALACRCSEAAERTERWMLSHLEERSVVGSNFPDPVKYYKWPLTLHWRGRDDDALRLLNWIAHRSLTDEGDFASDRTGFHSEFHSYANLWLIWAAAELGGSKLTQQTFQFLLKHQGAETSGLATSPVDRRVPYEDPLSTSFLGIVACALGREDVARSALRYLTTLFSKNVSQADKNVRPPAREACPRAVSQAGQDRPGHTFKETGGQAFLPDTGISRFWLRTLADGALVTQVPEGADPTTFVLELGKRHQCYYFLGAMGYFLARYMETFGQDEAGQPADGLAGLLETVGQEALSTIWAAKVGPGCVALYSVTGEEPYLDLARPVVEAVLGAQSPEGCWLKCDQPWITVSAEQCAWLTDITRRLKGEDEKL